MPVTLLPASAAAFAPRASPNVVLNSKVEPWLTATLKRINRIKRPLNSVPQHTRCLTETLSAPTAIWTLCSLMLPKAPEAELRKDANPLVEALFNYQLLHVEAYVVHVDMVSQNEVAFKLTQDTIDALVEYHKDVFSADTRANTWHWSEKDAQLQKLQRDFVQAANRFVYRAAATALEGLEEDGGGELLAGGADEVKALIMSLYVPLMPPPPRQPELVRPAPILPSSTGAEHAWWPSLAATQHGPPQHHQPPPPQQQQQPHESWKAFPSSPSATSSVDSSPNVWTTMSGSLSLPDLVPSTPSPAPAYSQPFSSAPEPYSSAAYTTAGYSTADYYSAPMTCAPLIPQLPLPSVLAQQCSTSAGLGGFGVGFAWDRYNEYALPYATF